MANLRVSIGNTACECLFAYTLRKCHSRSRAELAGIFPSCLIYAVFKTFDMAKRDVARSAVRRTADLPGLLTLVCRCMPSELANSELNALNIGSLDEPGLLGDCKESSSHYAFWLQTRGVKTRTLPSGKSLNGRPKFQVIATREPKPNFLNYTQAALSSY